MFQDQQSKIDVVNKWIKEHKKYESLDADKEEGEKAEEESKEVPDTAEAAHTKEEDVQEALKNPTLLLIVILYSFKTIQFFSSSSIIIIRQQHQDQCSGYLGSCDRRTDF